MPAALSIPCVHIYEHKELNKYQLCQGIISYKTVNSEIVILLFKNIIITQESCAFCVHKG